MTIAVISPKRINLADIGGVGQGVRTGPYPGRDNAGIIEDAFRRARSGDVLIGAVDQAGDPSWTPQLTFLDRALKVKVPIGVELSGPNGCPTAQGYVRRYWASDWRESVFPQASGSVLANFIVYLHTDFSAGFPFGIVSAEDEFVISPRIVNCQATFFGDGPGRWSGILSLDATAGNYARGGRGIRDFRIHDLIGWGYDYRGLHLAGTIAGVIDGYCQTRMSDKSGVLDVYVGGKPATPDNLTGPGYELTLTGPQLGTSLYMENMDRAYIDGPSLDNVTLAGNVTNSDIWSRVTANVTSWGTGNIGNHVNGKPV